MCPTIYRGRRRMEGENQQLLHQRKKKTRRLKKRRQRDSQRENVELDMVCKPLKLRRRGNSAPQNTTQFLMEDKMEAFPEYVISPSRSVSPVSSPSSASVSSSPISIAPVSEAQEGTLGFEDGQFIDDFDDKFFQKDFEETYDRIRGESLMSMSHAELLTQYLQLEEKEEQLKKKVKYLSECACNSPFNVIVNVSCANCGTCANVKSEPRFAVAKQNFDLQQTVEKNLSDEIEELRRLNCTLKEENTKLKCSIAATESRSC